MKTVQDLIFENNHPKTVLIDDTTTPNITYIGFALPGSLKTENRWQIFIMDELTGFEKKYAEGDCSYTFIWNNRASYEYK